MTERGTMGRRRLRRYTELGFIEPILEKGTQSRNPLSLELTTTESKYGAKSDIDYCEVGNVSYNQVALGMFKVTGSDNFIAVPEEFKHLIKIDNRFYETESQEAPTAVILAFEKVRETNSKDDRKRGHGETAVKDEYYLVNLG